MIKTLSFALVAVGSSACNVDSPQRQDQPRPALNTWTVTAESLPVIMPLDGTVRAVRRSTIATRVMARVSAINIEVGSRVDAGATLIELGIADVAAKRAKAEAALAAARAARVEAAREAARADTLYAQDAIPRVQRDRARLRLTQAESNVSIALATLEEVETAQQYAAIKAPFAGSIVSRYVDAGDMAVPGVPLLVIDADGPREAVIAVPADIARHIARRTLVNVYSADGLKIAGAVRAVASGADPASRTVEVRISLPDSWPTGIAVTALVPAGTEPAVAIPVSAVIRRGQLTGVRVMTDAGAVLRWVRLGRTVSPADPVNSVNGDPEPRVVVLTGLRPGERIVL